MLVKVCLKLMFKFVVEFVSNFVMFFLFYIVKDFFVDLCNVRKCWCCFDK